MNVLPINIPLVYDNLVEIPRQPLGFDHRDNARDMTHEFLLELTLQLHARCCMCNVSQALYSRAKELEAEVLRRMNQPPSIS